MELVAAQASELGIGRWEPTTKDVGWLASNLMSQLNRRTACGFRWIPVEMGGDIESQSKSTELTGKCCWRACCAIQFKGGPIIVLSCRSTPARSCTQYSEPRSYTCEARSCVLSTYVIQISMKNTSRSNISSTVILTILVFNFITILSPANS